MFRTSRRYRGDREGTPGQRVRAARTARHWTQGELAAKVGVHPVTISHVERGSRPLGPELAMKIAEATGRMPSTILPGLPWGSPAKLLRLVRSASGQYLPRGPADEATWCQVAGSAPVPLAELLRLADEHGITVMMEPAARG